MGHRDDLLDGAERCLYEKGFGRTTARDIVAASGTNLASIGYHFGSKDALLAEAAIRATGQWAEALEDALTGVDPLAGPAERREQAWRRVVELFTSRHSLWVTYVESLAHAGRIPELRKTITAAQADAREELATMFHALPEEPGEADRQGFVLGSLYQALLTGLLVQWIVDPETAPTGKDIADGLGILAGE